MSKRNRKRIKEIKSFLENYYEPCCGFEDTNFVDYRQEILEAELKKRQALENLEKEGVGLRK